MIYLSALMEKIHTAARFKGTSLHQCL